MPSRRQVGYGRVLQLNSADVFKKMTLNFGKSESFGTGLHFVTRWRCLSQTHLPCRLRSCCIMVYTGLSVWALGLERFPARHPSDMIMTRDQLMWTSSTSENRTWTSTVPPEKWRVSGQCGCWAGPLSAAPMTFYCRKEKTLKTCPVMSWTWTGRFD